MMINYITEAIYNNTIQDPGEYQSPWEHNMFEPILGPWYPVVARDRPDVVELDRILADLVNINSSPFSLEANTSHGIPD